MTISNLDKLHYSFCSDLGNKQIFDIIWPEQINFALFKIKQVIGGGGRTIPDTEIFIPGFYEVQKVGSDFWSAMTEKEYQTFIAPADYFADGSLFYVREKQIKIDILEIAQRQIEGEREETRQARIKVAQEFLQAWQEQPHLVEHATFQFYFLNNSLFTANLPYLRINDNNQIEVDWKIRATPSGTFWFFRSSHIFFKWKIEVRQGIVNMSLVKVAIEGITKMIGGAKQAIGKFFGIDASGIDKAKEDIAQNLMGRDRGKDFMERERITRNQELHTARMFQSTYQHLGDQAIEPSVFYANTVKFPYNLFDYWLRNEENPFICRIHYSNNLFNNLKHNNNINPITYPLNITFEKLSQILKPGLIQGNVYIDHDPNNKMTEAIARGVHFYDDKRKYFVRPDLGVKELSNQIQYSATGGDNYIAQAITEGGQGLEIDIPYTAEQRGYSHTTFIKLTNSSVQDDLERAVVAGCGCQANNLHYASSQGFCWGCTYDELKRVGFVSIKFTPSADCSMVLKLDKDSQGTRDLDLIAGTEYTVTIDETKFIFKSEGKTKITWQKQPTNNDFSNLDWSPPPGSGGEIEIPLEDPEIAIPEPGEGDPSPEPDFPVDPFDPTLVPAGTEPRSGTKGTGGEIELPPIEIDLPPDITQDIDNDQSQDPDPPPIDVDQPQDTDTSQDQDNSQDQDRGDQDPPQDLPGDDDDGD